MDASIARSLEKQDTTRKMQSLMGIISGVMADGHLNDSEILFLRTWLTENSALSNVWPASVILRKLDEVLEDGVIDEAERKHLTALLTSAAGVHFYDSGSVDTDPTTLPVNDCVTITLNNSSVCHTGEFYYGTRAACERLTLKAGGMPADAISKRVDILVIGSMSSRAWAQSSYGRKIEAAVNLQEKGHPIEIITEKRWLEAVDAACKGGPHALK